LKRERRSSKKKKVAGWSIRKGQALRRSEGRKMKQEEKNKKMGVYGL